MAALASGTGLRPVLGSPTEARGIRDAVTEEAAIRPPDGRAPQVVPFVKEGDIVAEGAAVAGLRQAPDIGFVAPIAGRVARIDLLPGKKLSEIVIFRERGGDRARHDPGAATTPAGLRRLMQTAGFWPLLRRRPFGGMPAPDEAPAAIAVMLADTRPCAPDPRLALAGREEAFGRGLAALERLTAGPVLVIQPAGRGRIEHRGGDGRVRTVECGHRHPQGCPGIRIHQLFPAGSETPVWDLHGEDVAALGDLLATGMLPATRLVRIAGPALREGRTVRTHPGADLRQLTRRLVAPGPHLVLSGSALDGTAAQWLGTRDRQVTVLHRRAGRGRPHWLLTALTRSARATPAIPTAPLAQAFGAVLPTMPFIRALAAGDEETAMRLGVLSLLEEDVALADYVLSEPGRISGWLRIMLDRIEREVAA